MSLLNPKPDIPPQDLWKREHDAWMQFQTSFPKLLREIEKNAEALKSQFPSVHAAWAETMRQLEEMTHSQAEQDKLKKNPQSVEPDPPFHVFFLLPFVSMLLKA